MTEIFTSVGAVIVLVTPAVIYIRKVIERRMRAVATEKKIHDAEVQRQIEECRRDRDSQSHRIFALELAAQGEFAHWERDSDGIFLAVSPEYVRLFGAPLGYKKRDFIGSTLEKLDKFSPELRATLLRMDQVALKNRYACASGVQISEGVRATIIKAAIASSSGDVLFLGYAVPEQ